MFNIIQMSMSVDESEITVQMTDEKKEENLSERTAVMEELD